MPSIARDLGADDGQPGLYKTRGQQRAHANAPIHFDGAAAARPDSAGADRQALERVRELIASGQMNASGRLRANGTLADNLSASAGARYAMHSMCSKLKGASPVAGPWHLRHHMRLATENLVHELSKLTNPVDTLEARLAIEPPQARLARCARPVATSTSCRSGRGESSRKIRRPTRRPMRRSIGASRRRARNPLLIAIFDGRWKPRLRQLAAWPRNRDCINNQANTQLTNRRIADRDRGAQSDRAEERCALI